MSEIIELLKQKHSTPTELVSMTIRVPAELAAQIDGLADYLEISRNETVLKLITPELKKVENEIENMKTEEDENIENENIDIGKNKFYLLNTNKAHYVSDHNRMVANGIAEAYSNPWKHYIDKIKEGDIVFLYENGRGIVAYGEGSGETKIGHRNNDPSQDECHYQKLRNYTVLKTPIKASEIRKLLGKKIPFLKTMIPLKDGKNILDRK